MSRRSRSPSAEEVELWERVAESVRPLRRRPKKPAPPALTAKPAPVEPQPEPKAKAKPPAASPKPLPPPAPTPAPLASLDRRTRSKITRGKVPIDARLDLHGLTQAAAHQRLRHFLAEAHVTGVRMALVITGKGAPDAERLGEERGVLRRVVPGWLGSGEFRALVIGFEPAGRRHGGEGALYVRIRSRKS
jgi:DNA-nicking Smr family endonuclease